MICQNQYGRLIIRIALVVSGVDRLPDRDSALLIGAGLSETTAYRATVYRLSVGLIRDNQADFPPILHLVACPVEVAYYGEPPIMPREGGTERSVGVTWWTSRHPSHNGRPYGRPLRVKLALDGRAQSRVAESPEGGGKESVRQVGG